MRRNRAALQVFIELRNVLSHRSYQRGLPIATPLPSTVTAVEQLRDELARPTLALNLATRGVLTARHDDPLASLLREMTANDISQVPVYGPDDRVALLTTNAIARWVAKHLEPDGTLLIDAGTTSDALALAESHERLKVVRRTSTAADVLDELTQSEPPAAILITDGGRPGHAPLGILAATDVGRLVTALTIEAY